MRALTRYIVHAVLFAACACIVACSTGQSPGADQETIQVTRGLDQSERAVRRSPIESRDPHRRNATDQDQGVSATAMVIADTSIDWAMLKPRLVEAAGPAVLEELALDALLERRAREAGIAASPPLIERERQLLIASYIDSGVAADLTQAERLVAQVRASRGLGMHRFDDMLRRNAILRALVADRVRIDETAIQRAYELRHGPRYRVRLITTSSASQASRAADRVRSGQDFSRVAAELSTDPSAARGGVVEPISPADITYPDSLRRILPEIRIGSMSTPIALESGYAIVVLDAVEGPTGGDWATEQRRQPPLDRVRPELIAMETRRQERLLMDQLVRELLASPAIRFEDPDLARAWRTRSEPR